MSDSRAGARTSLLAGRIVARGDTPASIANIANIVTVARIFLAPIFIAMLLADAGAVGPLRYAATALFVVAITTDAVDGRLARGRNLVTELGIILDPIADKVLIGGALSALSILGEFPTWITVLVLLREFGITALRFAVLSHVVIPASIGGKAKTVVQACAVAVFLCAPWTVLGAWAGWLAWTLMVVAIVLTLYTGVEYLVRAYQGRRR